MTTRMLAAAQVLLGLAVAGCNTSDSEPPETVPEIMPGILQGYLQEGELPNSLTLLPPPPAEGSAALARDVERSQDTFAHHDTERWGRAIVDADLEFPAAAEPIADLLGFSVTEADTPYLYQLLRRSLTDAGLSTYAAKNHYARPRPYMVNNERTCTPEDEEAGRHDGSYPSGHTAIGWAWALIMVEIVPERTDAILEWGREFGRSRMVCNVHWQSDVDEGRFMGAATVARLHADAGFLSDLERAKAEVRRTQSVSFNQ
ncbi:MAG: phosphatase PAP2 family protein [Gemmatimonadota bacterium]|nr:MAG: phosphatase PAP2 family protein [Gemmatimonadota bacterium]